MLEVGDTFMVPPVKLPGIHVYVHAPVNIQVTLPPLQIVVLDGLAAIVGVGVTLIVMVFVELQLPLNPVTVYEPVPVGLTVITGVVCAPGDQENVEAPLAVNVTVCPAQIFVEEAVMLMVGVVVTLMVKVLGELTQLPLLPVTVYTVVEDGVKVLVLPEPPGNQV
jgi:hypothetical protein